MHEVPVVVAGGGTGGHLYPALALAEALVDHRPDVRPFFVGAKRGLEARVLPERGVDHLLFDVRGLDRARPWRNLGVLTDLMTAVRDVRRAFEARRPALAVLTGGYASAPAGIAAVLERVPLVLQEQNSFPGFTTRRLARWARQIHLAYPEAAEHLPRAARGRTLAAGNPVRAFQRLPRAEARARFGLPATGFVVLVVGGSQGGRGLNRGVLDLVQHITSGRANRPDGLSLLWATGPTHEAGVRAEIERLGAPSWVSLHGYLHDMEAALSAADLAVSRAGAMTTSEHHLMGLPAILVPLPTSAAGHQEHNARALEAAGAAQHLPEAELTGAALLARITALMADPDQRKAMARAASERAVPDAASKIASAMDVLLPRPR